MRRRDSDDDYDKPRERTREVDYIKTICIGKGLCAIVFAAIALLCQIISFSVNEITENEEFGLACGWNKAVNLDGPSGDVTFAELCSNCPSDDCAACTNQSIGQFWLWGGLISFFVTIGALVAIVIFWFCDWSWLNCWIKILFGVSVACILGAILQYIYFGNCELCCWDHSGQRYPKMHGSFFWAIAAGLFQGVAVICTCGLGLNY